MVIFVLLLVTKLNNQASEATSAVLRVLKELKAQAQKRGDDEQNIKKQGDVIVIVIPEELMSFKQGSAQQGGTELSSEGRQYLRRQVPGWSNLLCRPDVRRDIDTIVVEGHADRRPFGKVDQIKSEELNLELSQQRSMAVVAEALDDLNGSPDRACFLELLSATGRGDTHPLDEKNPDSEKNRRVEVRIRVRPNVAESVNRQTDGSLRR
jgi:flagellar motor protein MotB